MIKQNSTTTLPESEDDGIPNATYTVIGACTAAIIGVVVFQAAYYFLCDDYN